MSARSEWARACTALSTSLQLLPYSDPTRGVSPRSKFPCLQLPTPSLTVCLAKGNACTTYNVDKSGRLIKNFWLHLMRCVIAATRGLGISFKNFESLILLHVRGTPKIKFKKVIKKRTVTVRSVIMFWNILLKASIADLITLLSSSVQLYQRVIWPKKLDSKTF